MAGDTNGGRALEYIIDVALRALQRYVRPSQRENRFRVIESRWQPGGCTVAQCTIRSELPIVCIVLGVASITIRWRPGKLVINMAALARCGHVCPGQWEHRRGMVERRWNPAAGTVASPAQGAESTGMGIIFGVAIIAKSGHAGELVVDMAALAWHRRMFSGQRERRLGVVKRRRAPSTRVMAVAALWP